ncbi:hypothetical protein AMECASPLE_030326 [Ameca splendens]|uniref:Uncharacterized protein n=1 Tax=Ameca splendens TaxID=208324 RepID=A0ABV0XV11_9TELE
MSCPCEEVQQEVARPAQQPTTGSPLVEDQQNWNQIEHRAQSQQPHFLTSPPSTEEVDGIEASKSLMSEGSKMNEWGTQYNNHFTYCPSLSPPQTSV